jgi:cell wall-associated NlpC family hydrolase
VQISLNAAGIACPRDSDMQQNKVGHSLDASDWRALRRGDLVFWKGHVAIARDSDTMVHANAHHMATAIENTADAVARIAAAGSAIAAIKRI